MAAGVAAVPTPAVVAAVVAEDHTTKSAELHADGLIGQGKEWPRVGNFFKGFPGSGHFSWRQILCGAFNQDNQNRIIERKQDFGLLACLTR